jgi:hypothetical protein
MKRLRSLLRRLESGSNADDFGYAEHTVVMFAVLVLGVMLAAIGVERAGAAVAAERGAYVAAVTRDGDAIGTGAAWSFFFGFAGRASNHRVTTTRQDQTVDVELRRSWLAWAPLFGQWGVETEGGMRKRVERFYRQGEE